MRTNLQTICRWSACGVLVVAAGTGAAAVAQQRRRPAPQPVPSLPVGEAQLISTAEDEANQPDTSRGATSSNSSPRTVAPSAPRRTTAARPAASRDSVAVQMSRLVERLDKIEANQSRFFSFERLAAVQQRILSLRKEVRELEREEATLQASADDTEFQLQPNQLQLRLAGQGTLNPTALREQVTMQLERELQRTRSQLSRIAADLARLNDAITTAENEAELIRAQIGNEAAAPAPESEASPTEATGTEPQ